MNGNILVTGGAGYIGSHLIRLLLKANYKVIVFDDLSRGHHSLIEDLPIVFIEGDLKEYREIESAFAGNKVDAVIHLAAFAYVGESIEQPELYFRNNICGTINLVSAMRRYNVPKIIFSSTCAVYGTPQKLPIKENTPLKPISPYGYSKKSCEEIIQNSISSYACLRYFNVAGACPEGNTGEWHEPETHIIPLALNAAKESGEFRIFGDDFKTRDGTCIRDYIHVVDLAMAHLSALKFLDKNSSLVCNLGTGSGYSVKEILDCVKGVTGSNFKIKAVKRRQGDPAKLTATSELAILKLGWTPQYNLKQMIEHAWCWFNSEKFINLQNNN